MRRQAGWPVATSHLRGLGMPQYRNGPEYWSKIMGWLFSHRSKDELVKSLLNPNELREGFRILDHSLVGGHLWLVVERDLPDGACERIICLELIEAHAGQWGNKSISEREHPYYFDCPLRLLDLAGPTISSKAEEWRQAVREFHAARARRRRKAAPGALVEYGGTRYRLSKSLGRKGWEVFVEGDASGQAYRLKSTQLSNAEFVDAP